MSEIYEVLSHDVDETYIQSLKFDLSEGSLFVSTNLFGTERWTQDRQFALKGINFFNHVTSGPQERLDPETWELVELTSVVFFRSSNQNILTLTNSLTPISKIDIVPNFLLEIWSGLLYFKLGDIHYKDYTWKFDNSLPDDITEYLTYLLNNVAVEKSLVNEVLQAQNLSQISNFEVDLKEHNIYIDFTTHQQNTQVSFHGVSAYCGFNLSVVTNHKTHLQEKAVIIYSNEEICSFLEFSTLRQAREKEEKQRVSETGSKMRKIAKVKQKLSTANFAIITSSHILLIEANAITVDNQYFKVGYPATA